MAEAPSTPISGEIMEEAAPRPVFPASPELLWADRASRGPGLKHFKGALAPGSGAGWEHKPAADRRERRGSSGGPALGTVRDADVVLWEALRRAARGTTHLGQEALPPNPAEPPPFGSAARSGFSSHFCPGGVRADCEGQ